MRITIIVLFLITTFAQANNKLPLPLSPAAIEAKHADLTAPYSDKIQTEHFNLYHDIAPQKAKTLIYLIEFSYYRFLETYAKMGFDIHLPQKQLNWICFSNAPDFTEYALYSENRNLSWLTGYYSAKTNAVTIKCSPHLPDFQSLVNPQPKFTAEYQFETNTAIVEIIHEAAHQLAFNCGLQKRGVLYPLWACEGPALLYEGSLPAFMKQSDYSQIRLEQLSRLRKNKNLIPIRKLITLTGLYTGYSKSDTYAQALGFYKFLLEEHTKSLIGYFNHLASLEPGNRTKKTMLREFQNAFGPIATIEKQWLLYLSRINS